MSEEVGRPLPMRGGNPSIVVQPDDEPHRAAFESIDNSQSPYCVLAWWDVDMYIGAYKKRKTTSRPLRKLENTLGHRVHVESRWVHSRLAKGYRKFEAYNYLDTSDQALAAVFVLRQISGLSEWFSGIGFNFVSALSADRDIDESTISAFYWHEPEQQEYRHICSGGVLLALDSKYPKLAGGRPIVKIKQILNPTASYEVKIVIRFSCDNRQELVESHWPELARKYGVSADAQVDFGPQPKDDQPNEIAISKNLVDVTEHEAIAYCLNRTERCRFKLCDSDDVIFRAERSPVHPPPFDGISSISLTRLA